MGNGDSSDWREQFECVEGTGNLRTLMHRGTRERYDLLTLAPASEPELQTLLGRISLRTAKPSPYLLPLHSFAKHEPLVCSTQTTLDLIFKSAASLEDHFTLRRVKNEGFSREEVEYVIARVAGGLNDIREMREQYGRVCLGTVFVEGEVRLKDPLLLGAEARSRKLQGYPSPQKLYSFFDSHSSFEEHTSDLFSLGVLALQLLYPQQNLGGIYKNAQSRYLNCAIDAAELRAYINNIQDPGLKQYVAVLTHGQPTKRREVYQMLNSRRISTEGLRILKENPFEITNQPVHNPEKEKPSIKPQEPLKVTQPVFPQEVKISRESISFDIQRAREVQSFPILNASPVQTVSPLFAPVPLNPPVFASPPRHTEVEPWRPSQIFESTFRNLREDTESTPINKINGAVSFKFPTNDLVFPKTTFSSLEGVAKVSPKFIESTYRNSFIPGETEVVAVQSTTAIEKAVKSSEAIEEAYEIMKPTKDNEEKECKEVPQESPSLPYQAETPAKQESPELEVKTSSDAIQIVKESSQATDHIIKFESVPTKLVESLSSIERERGSVSVESGFVVEEYDIGTRYEGFKRNGMRNGHGEFIYKEGSKYKGDWRDNKMEGFGTLYYPNGAVAYEGQWLDDEFDGNGAVFNDNPTPIRGGFDYTNFNTLDEEWTKYEGQLRRDAKEGLGKLFLTNGEVYSGGFENDQVHGEGEFRRANGSVIRGLWQEGLLKKIYH